MLAPSEVHVPVGARAGEYEVRSLLGRGGMGTVYAGVHPMIGKEVAIKVLDPRLATSEAIVERFVREARAVNTIQHPNIIDIFAFGHSPELGHYFVMPRLKGQSLAERIDQGAMPVDEALPVLAQIVAALDAAHAANITHRDLKPDNVFLVGERGAATVQLLDFGVAKLLDYPGSMTQTGVQIGTPLFMAPEQWESAGIDHRTDVYALGILVHHMFTQRYPFEAETPVALMNKHCLHGPTLPSAHGGPPALDAIVARALAKDKLARPQSAGEVYAGVAAALAPPRATIVTMPPQARPQPHRVAAVSPLTTLGASSGSLEEQVPPPRRVAPIVAALAGVAILVVAVVALTRTRGSDASEPAGAAASEGLDAAALDPALDATLDPSLVALPDAGAVGAATDARPRIDATRPPVRIDARTAPPIDAAPAVLPDARRPRPDARPRPIDARAPSGRRDAGAMTVAPIDAPPLPRAPRDAAPRRPPVDSAWGSTVNPFGTPP